MKHMVTTAAVVSLIGLGAGQAFAQPTHARTVTKVTIVMHDPGCHWFSVGGKLKTKLVVAGPARLLNVDGALTTQLAVGGAGWVLNVGEAALKIVAAGATRRVGIGKTMLLGPGTYAITMIGQAADDNHLKLVVR